MNDFRPILASTAPTRHPLTVIALHWLTAILILAASAATACYSPCSRGPAPTGPGSSRALSATVDGPLGPGPSMSCHPR
jgi:hypothetical protein